MFSAKFPLENISAGVTAEGENKSVFCCNLRTGEGTGEVIRKGGKPRMCVMGRDGVEWRVFHLRAINVCNYAASREADGLD